MCSISIASIAVGLLASPLDPELATAGACLAGATAVLTSHARLRRVAVLASLAASGIAHGGCAAERTLAPPLTQWFESRLGAGGRLDDSITAEGTLLTDAALTEGGVQMLVSITRVRDGAGWAQRPGRVQLRISGGLAVDALHEWRAGRHVRTVTMLRRPRILFNYGGPSPRLQALRRPFDLTGTVKSAALVEITPGSWWSETASAIRARVRQSLATEIGAGGAPRSARAAAVATAILIGDRAGLTEEMERRLQEAGTYHVIAISGGNIAVIAALAFALACALTRSARARSLMTLATIVAYGSIVAPDPSVTRAVAAACLYLAIGLAGLVPRPLHVLAVVAAGIAIVDPASTSDVGAWLSFGATLGILLMTGPIVSSTLHRLPARGHRIARPVVALVAASIAAELALLPIAAGVFGRLSLAGLVLNVVAIPAMAVLQVAGVIVAVVTGIWPWFASLAATMVRYSADALLESARLVEVVPALSWRVPPTAIGWTALYYSAGALALFPALGRWRRPAIAAAIAATFVIVTAPAIGAARPAAGWVRLTMVDVGQGEALLAQLPSGHDLLVDAGGGPGSFDVGARVVTPAVWALGSRRIEWLAITHADLDHIGGAAAVLDDLDPREIWEGVPVIRDAGLRHLLHAARERGVVRREIRRGDVLEAGGVTIAVCHPPAPEWERQRVRNDDSTVLRIRYGDVEMLLTGDAGTEFEKSWPAESSDAPIRILKAAHHGSRTSSAAAFVESYRPQAVLVSVGRGNPFGHPAPVVLGRFQDVGADVFRTDTDGAISVETDGVEVRVRTALGRTWRMAVWRWPT